MVAEKKARKVDGLKNRIKDISFHPTNEKLLHKDTNPNKAVVSVMGKNLASRNFIAHNLTYNLSNCFQPHLFKKDTTEALATIKVNELTTDCKAKYAADFKSLVEETDCFIVNCSDDLYITDLNNIISDVKTLRKSVHVPVIFITTCSVDKNVNKINLSEVLAGLGLEKTVDFSILDIAYCFESLTGLVMEKLYTYIEKEMFEDVDDYASLDNIRNRLYKEKFRPSRNTKAFFKSSTITLHTVS